MNPVRRASFVVRVVEGRQDAVSGIVECVATGAKEAFSGVEGIGRVIEAMLHGARLSSSSGWGLTPSPGAAVKDSTSRRTPQTRPTSMDRD